MFSVITLKDAPVWIMVIGFVSFVVWLMINSKKNQ